MKEYEWIELNLPWSQSTRHSSLLKEIERFHIMSTHDSGDFFGPDHDENLDTLVSLVDKDLSQCSLIFGQIVTSEKLEFVPNSPTRDTNELAGFNQSLV